MRGDEGCSKEEKKEKHQAAGKETWPGDRDNQRHRQIVTMTKEKRAQRGTKRWRRKLGGERWGLGWRDGGRG